MTSTIRRLVIAGCVGGAISGLAAGSAQAASPPPMPTTLPATGVGTTPAVRHGTVATGGQAVLWEFQYGKTLQYGQHTAAGAIPAGHGTAYVSAAVTRLKPGTRYHFSLLTENGGMNGAGTPTYPLNFYFGPDQTFFTKRLGRLSITTSKLSVRTGIASIPVRCAITQSCKGKLTLTLRAGSRTLTLARKSFTILADAEATLKPKLSKTGLTLLDDASGQRLAASLNARFFTGQPKFSKRVTLILK